jgi:hypothetical protein
VEECPPCTVDSSDDLGVEFNRIGCDRRRIVRIGVEESAPTPPESDHLVTLLSYAVDYCLYARIETRDIAPTRENPYTHGALLLSP